MVHLSETSEFMDTYSNFQPTGLDIKGLNLKDQQNWYVLPVQRTRDSETLETSNWHTAISLLDALDDTSDETPYETHSFGHWACGWFEIILINPNNDDACKLACEIVSSLADYPVLDDEHYSSLEWDDFEESAVRTIEWIVQNENAIPGNQWSELSSSFCLSKLCGELEWWPNDRTPSDEEIISALVELNMVQEDKS